MRRSGASPFGIVLSGEGDVATQPPWPSWSYRPCYLQGGEAIAFPLETSLNEPAIAYAGFLRPSLRQHGATDPHVVQLASLTRLRVALPDTTRVSPATQRLRDEGLIEFVAAGHHLLRLEFGRGTAAGADIDLRPHLPVILEWSS